MAPNPVTIDDLTLYRPDRDHPAALERVTGRQLGAGLGWSAALAVLLAAAITLTARAVAPHWARTEGLTVAIVAAVYLTVIAGLTIAAGGPRGVHRLLALHRPTAGQLGLSFAALVAAVAAGIGVSLAFSFTSGGVPATLRAIVAAGSDEARLPTATALTWALIVIRLLFLTGTAEELLFRGAVYSWLRRRASVPVTIAVTAVLFTAEHAFYPVLIPLVLSYGLAAGWVRHRTRSTATTIAMHITIDLALFLAAVALS
ncbi:MAG: lysostaphin resistance A-like protein [Streptosporangiaceae bacterium]